MQSPLIDGSPWHPLFGSVPYKFLWNGIDSTSVHLPPLLHPTAFPFSQVPPHVLSPPPAVLNMLAAQERAGHNQPHLEFGNLPLGTPLVQLMRMSEERKNALASSCPVTPPLTPLVPVTPTVADQSESIAAETISAAKSVAAAALPAQPPRVSSRTRRPPAFIEGQSACPLCGLLLRASDLAEHYQKELESMNADHHSTPTNRKRETRVSSRISEKKAQQQEESRKNMLARVKHNRKCRSTKAGSTGRHRKCSASSTNTTSSSPSQLNTEPEAGASTSISATAVCNDAEPQVTTACPVCNKMMSCSSEEMTVHVESCLSKQSSDCSSNQDGSDEEYETYTWCGETRIRATSLLDSNELAASGFNTVNKLEDDETTVVVDDDMNEQQFGESQYSEADIIPCASEEPAEAKAQSALRKAVISLPGGREGPESRNNVQSKWTEESSAEDSELPLRCLICMDKYSKPLVSVQCWHVHCEECWLRTLGAKKLCPQCNIITSPTDLRRIYL